MALEQEMKLAVEELGEVRRRLEALGGRCTHPSTFEDNVVLDTADQRLLAASSLLRVRRWGERVLLTYKGPPRFAGGVKTREERQTTAGDLDELLAILAALGFQPARRYQKRRESWDLEGVEVELDDTPMGCFVELEGAPDQLAALARRLGLDPARAARGSYMELWLAWRRDHPEAPVDMLFP